MRARNTLLVATAAAILGITAFGATAHAQEKGGAKKPGGERSGGPGGQRQRRPSLMTRAAKELNLTEAQKPKVMAILKKAGEERKAIRENTSLTSEQKTEKRRGLEKKTLASVEALLTADQKKKLTAIIAKDKAEREARAKERAKERAAAKPSAKKPGA
jgi:Spy/CpxP family protein refolding chaperone